MKKVLQLVIACTIFAVSSVTLNSSVNPNANQFKSAQPAQQQDKVYKYDIFEYKLPPNWILNKEGTDKEFLTFSHIVNGELRYHVRLRYKPTPAKSQKLLEEYVNALIEIQNDKKDYVDHVEKPGRYSTLGVKNCWMFSYIAPSFNHRGFVLTPVVDGQMYRVYVFDKIDKNKALRKEAVDFIAGIRIAGKGEKRDKLAEEKVKPRELELIGEKIPASKPIPFLDINKITAAQWDGAVSAAMEGMRMVYGPMNREQEKEFTDSWAPLRQTPFKEAVDYLNKFNPLLGEFLIYRSAVVQTGQLLEEAVINAGYAAEFDDPEGVLAYKDLAERYRNLLIAREKRLQEVTRDLIGLGNPPDGRALMAQMQGRYKKEKEYLKSLVTEFTPEGCWAGIKNQFFDPRNNLGEVYYPEYFYVYKIDTTYYTIELCINCNFQRMQGQCNVSGGKGDIFIKRELTVPDYTGRGVGGARDGQIVHRWLKFDYPAIPHFPETSDQRFKELIDKESKKNFSVWLSSFTKEMSKNALADAFFKTAIKWTEEEKWDDFTHDNESVFIPDELRIAFAGEMGGAAPASQTGKVSQVKEQKPAPVFAGNALHIAEDKTVEERKKIDLEAIEFHKTNLAIIERNMAKDRAEMAKERDPKRREEFKLRILGAEADLQAEKDRIATIQTGEIVHSRSPWDEYAKAGFIQNIAQNQQRLENMTRSIRKAYEMADKLPDDKAREVREIINSKFRGEMVGDVDEAKVKAIIEEANSVAKGYYQAKMAVDQAAGDQARAEAEWADACLQTAEVVKTTADYSMMGLSLFGGQYVNNIYQGVTGYIEGGPKEAFLRVAGSYNTVTGIAVDGFRGFEEAVNNGGDFMDGIKGAGLEAAKGYITEKALSFGAGKISSTFARPNGEFPEIDHPGSKGVTQAQTSTRSYTADPVKPKAKPMKSPDDFNRPLSAEEIAVYRQQVSDARVKVTSYKKTYKKLEQARKAGAPPSEIKKILVELDDRSAKIHSSPQAKMMMKTLQKNPNNLDLIKRYSNSMDRVHQKVEKRFQQEMDQRGWSKEELEPIRNRPDPAELQRARDRQARGEQVSGEDLLGTKTVNMDYDAGRKPKPGPDGKPLPPSKNGEPTSIEAWHAEAQEAWERAYLAETGQSPTHSWENITHSKLGDAYRDLSVLQKNGILHANKSWAGQTADVTYYKAEEIRSSPEFQRVEKYVEIARGTAKDYRTKMNPLFEKRKPKAGTASYEAWKKHKDYWDKINSIMDQMGSGRKDPLSADREIREITGGKSMLEVTFDMRNFMESLMVL